MCEAKKKKYLIDNVELMTQWDWEKNNEIGLNPEELTCGVHKKAWWICNKGHRWEADINSRNKNHGCPCCSGRSVIIGVNDLATTHPELAREWHPAKNGSLTVKDVMYGSGKKVWWICDKGHEWKASVNSRTNKGNGCPYCSNKKILVGYNDLATTHPELAREWHPTKNGSLTAYNVTRGSGKKVWWLGECGHEWEDSVSNRNPQKCPCCIKELGTSFAEQAIFFYCKMIDSDSINRDVSFGKEIDVYLPKYNIGIEYNGLHWHRDKEKEDLDKIKYFLNNNIKIITVKEGLVNRIDQNIIEHNYRDNDSLNFVIKSIFDLLDVQFDKQNIDVYGHEDEIYNQYISIKKENSIANKKSESIVEWDYKKNGNVLPTMIAYSSKKKVWWKCKDCGNEWKESVTNYYRRKMMACPKCAKKNYVSSQRKKVICVDTGKIYNSLLHASEETGISDRSISLVCKGAQKTAGKLRWEFIDKNAMIIKTNRLNKLVRCIETGVIYKSITHAGSETNIGSSSIANACNGRCKTAGGYRWEFVDESLKDAASKYRKCMEQRKEGQKKKVRCIETGIIYNSITNASKDTNIPTVNISAVCNGRRKTTGGYHWEFVDKDTH